MWKNKNIKVVPDDLTFPAEYLFKYFYQLVIEKNSSQLLPLFLDYILENQQVISRNFSWNRKYLYNVTLNKDDMKNPRIEGSLLKFELDYLKYKDIKEKNRSSLSFYDLSRENDETFTIDLHSVALEMLKNENKSFEVSYFENSFLNEGKTDEKYKYINVSIPLFDKNYNLVGYYDNDFSDVETCFSALAFNLSSRKKSDYVKCWFADKNSSFPLKKNIFANDQIKSDYVGLFKYYDNVGTREKPSYSKNYIKIPSKSIYEKGKYFTFNCDPSNFYSLMDTNFKTIDKKVNGIDLLDYIRHNISSSYKNYENVGVGEKKGIIIGYPRVLNILQENSPYSLENTYLIPAPVYKGKKYEEQEKQYDNSDNIFPDSLEKLVKATNAETVMKYHNNRGLFFIESALDINSYYSSLDYNRTAPSIKLNKDSQLQLHYGKNDFIRRDGVLVPYVKKLPFKIGEIVEAKNHARKVFQFKEKNYYEGKRKEIPTPWKYDDFDTSNEEDYSVLIWKETFISQENFDNWKSDFLENIEETSTDLYLIPLPKENSKDEQSVVDYANYHILINHSWFCKLDDLKNSLIDDIDSNITSLLNKAFQYQNYSLDNSGKYVLGSREEGMYSHYLPIFKIVNEEEYKELRKKVYSKWIENNINRKPNI